MCGAGAAPGAGGGLLEQAPSRAQSAHCCWAWPGQALESGHHCQFDKCLDRAAPGPGLALLRAGLCHRRQAGRLVPSAQRERAGLGAGLPSRKNKQAQSRHC